MSHVFDRSGLASLDDLEAPEYRSLFAELETAHSQFLLLGKQFRGNSYKWPINPLRWWSRCWEYPYVLYHVRKWREKSPEHQPVVVDLGCGVTFMPFCVARENCLVIGVDIDPVAEEDLLRAATVVPASPGSVRFRSTDGQLLPFEDGEIDALYCVSVLEHMLDPAQAIREAARVIKKDGLLVLTLDVALEDNCEIGPGKFKSLLRAAREYFDPKEPDETVHPLRLLRSDNGPYPWNIEYGMKKWLRPLKEGAKLLLGRDRMQRWDLACYGTVLIRK